MGSGFSKMKKQARLMQEQFETMRQELKSQRFTASSGSGLVTLTLNGDKELIELNIQPDCVDRSDVEGLQDLIKAAHAAACQLASQEASAASGMPGGLPFPL
jgi:hypothetical protein